LRRAIRPTSSYSEADAFGQLFDRTHVIVFRYIYGLGGGSPQDVEDLTAETFLRAWRARHSFGGSEDAALGWLLQIARRLVIDNYRRRQRRGREESLETVEIRSPEAGPEEAALEREQWNRVWRFTQDLPEQQREMLVLRYLLGWQVKQIAAQMDLTENAVSVSLKRIIERLAAMHGEEEQ